MSQELHYKVVETSNVSEEELTKILNEMAAEGYTFDGFHFAMREGSHRPSMAFILFHRGGEAS